MSPPYSLIFFELPFILIDLYILPIIYIIICFYIALTKVTEDNNINVWRLQTDPRLKTNAHLITPLVTHLQSSSSSSHRKRWCPPRKVPSKCTLSYLSTFRLRSHSPHSNHQPNDQSRRSTSTENSYGRRTRLDWRGLKIDINI